MSNEQHNYSLSENDENETDLREIVDRYLYHWKWFAAGFAVFMLLAWLYLRYATPQFEVRASILIKDDKKGGAMSELSAFEDLGLLKGNSNIDNEIELLKSRSLMTRVVKELNLNLRYFRINSPRSEELYNNSPVHVSFIAGDSSVHNMEGELRLQLSAKGFTISESDESSAVTGAYGDTVETNFGRALILRNEGVPSGEGEYLITLSPLNKVVEAYRELIKIEPANAKSNVINISLKEASVRKGAAIIDNMIQQHNADAIDDKNQISRNTADFINERIRFITSELSVVEQDAELFKTRHKLVDVESEAKLFLQSGSASEVAILETSTQKQLADYMSDYIQRPEIRGDLLPANLGISDVSVNSVIANYNTLVLERNRLLRNSSERNPAVQNIDAQLASLRVSLRESLLNLKRSLQIKLDELGRQEREINSRIASVPRYEREYRIIQRQQQIKEALYLYLLQKREETNIALAVTVSNSKVIDHADSNGEVVSPKKKVVFLLALILSLLLPVLVIYIRGLLDNKVNGKKDLDRAKLPFLGDIPLSDTNEKIIVTKGSNSSIAEAFRLLRTNVDFMLGQSQKKGRTVFLTSTLSKEGKSFIALNLASSLAISGKKVLLMGMDVRAPKLLEYLGIPDAKGLTNYVADRDLELDSVIMRSVFMEGLDLLPSGSIPPNPSELLMESRIGEVFERVKAEYDYIIVDTAPVGMVTDTLLLSKYADCSIFVVRAYQLDKRLLSVAENVYREKRLPNMAVLLNGTDKRKGYGYGYGYGYGGYGYGQGKKPNLFSRLFKKRR